MDILWYRSISPGPQLVFFFLNYYIYLDYEWKWTITYDGALVHHSFHLKDLLEVDAHPSFYSIRNSKSILHMMR
jgi:hypothetical protein